MPVKPKKEDEAIVQSVPVVHGGHSEVEVKPNVVGQVKVGSCDYDVVVKGDPKGEYEVELVGVKCDLRSSAKAATAIIDIIFQAKRVVYTPPMKFEKVESE